MVAFQDCFPLRTRSAPDRTTGNNDNENQVSWKENNWHEINKNRKKSMSRSGVTTSC